MPICAEPAVPLAQRQERVEALAARHARGDAGAAAVREHQPLPIAQGAAGGRVWRRRGDAIAEQNRYIDNNIVYFS